VLDEEDLGRAEELLGDDDAAEGVAGGGAGVADYYVLVVRSRDR
jgi:hypothetical protein